MSAEATSSVINSWDTVRYELLNTRVCDLHLRIRGSPVEPFVRRLFREFALKRMVYRPRLYLTDSWGCPNEVPLIGIPLYLADKRLARLELEQTGEIEDSKMIMMLLRHEAGHAVNYAYRLWEYPGWTEIFGRFRLPYRDVFEPRPSSRQFVRHLVTSQYRWTYAQKHPDEDFAETFAVWLTPRSGWQRRYGNWPAVRKLRYVASLMQQIRGSQPVCAGGRALYPVESLTMRLAEHYGERADRYRASAFGYVDDKLRELFPPFESPDGIEAHRMIRKFRRQLIRRVLRWARMDEEDVELILRKLEDRARELNLRYPRGQAHDTLLDLTALTTALAMDFGYTGRFGE